MTTIAEIQEIVAQTTLNIKELSESHKEVERIMAKSREETEEALKASTANLNASIKASIAEVNDQINKWIGYTGNSIGYITELILIPGIKKKLNEFGHQFNSLSPRKQYFRKEDGKNFVEVDLFLENGEEVMIVEVKSQLSVKDVERHLKRLQLLRKHESESGLQGKTLLAAVAGLSIDDEAREMASKLGMYIIEMVENDKSVNVIKPVGELGKW